MSCRIGGPGPAYGLFFGRGRHGDKNGPMGHDPTRLYPTAVEVSKATMGGRGVSGLSIQERAPAPADKAARQSREGRGRRHSYCGHHGRGGSGGAGRCSHRKRRGTMTHVGTTRAGEKGAAVESGRRGGGGIRMGRSGGAGGSWWLELGRGIRVWETFI